MEIATTAPPDVQASPRRPRRKATPRDVSTSAPKDGSKKRRNDGRIASTILLSPEVDEWLSWMARAKGEDRSTLAARFILAGLARNTSLAREAAEAIERLRVAALAKSDAGEDRPSDVAPMSQVETAA